MLYPLVNLMFFFYSLFFYHRILHTLFRLTNPETRHPFPCSEKKRFVVFTKNASKWHTSKLEVEDACTSIQGFKRSSYQGCKYCYWSCTASPLYFSPSLNRYIFCSVTTLETCYCTSRSMLLELLH